MPKKALSLTIVALLVLGTFTFSFRIQQVKAIGTIYIRADGSVDPPTAPIQINGDVYSLTDNIDSIDTDGIVIQRNSTVFDGQSYKITGSVPNTARGIMVDGANNVSIINTSTEFFDSCVYLSSSNFTSMIGNHVGHSPYGVGFRLEASNFASIVGNYVEYANSGIFLDGSNNSIVRNSMDENGFGITMIGASYCEIARNNITKSGQYGIKLDGARHNLIADNKIEGFQYGSDRSHVGIQLISCFDNNITGNNISVHDYYGISFYQSSNNSIMDNSLTFDFEGLNIYSSLGNTIYRNNVSMNEVCGLKLYQRSDSNSIIENNITDNALGIVLSSSLENMINHNNFINNSQQASDEGSFTFWNDGYPSGGNYWSDYADADLYHGPYQNETGSDNIGDSPYVIGSNNRDNYPLMRPYVVFENQTIFIRADGSVDPSGAPIVRAGDEYAMTSNVTSNADGIVIERDNTTLHGTHCTLRGSGTGYGLYLSERRNVTVESFDTQDFDTAIVLSYSSFCKVSGNKATNNRVYGILLNSSSDNTALRNYATNNGEYGIALYSSSDNNNVTENDAKGNLNGIMLDQSDNCTVSTNDVTDNEQYGIVVESLSKCCLISGNRVEGNKFGIWLGTVTGCVVSENNVARNKGDPNSPSGGIYVGSSSDCTVFGNNVTENAYSGIYVEILRSSSLIVCHNNISNNSHQACVTRTSVNMWDNGCEGNYWSDYKTKYPNATQVGNSGIWDTPYEIDMSNFDRYPLMNVYWSPCDINHDLKVDMRDMGTAARAFGTVSGDQLWNPHADITGSTQFVSDGRVDMRDIGLVAKHFGERFQ